MAQKKAKKVIFTIVIVSLLVLPFLSSVRRALNLYGTQGFQNDTFWQLLWSSIQNRYFSLFTDYTRRE